MERLSRGYFHIRHKGDAVSARDRAWFPSFGITALSFYREKLYIEIMIRICFLKGVHERHDED